MTYDQTAPKPPFPKQSQERPGLESRMDPRPQYEAPAYRAADKLLGKVALITGGDSGIGRAVAVLFAREGAKLSIVYLPEEEEDAQECREAIEAEGGEALLLPGDVTSERFCVEAVNATVEAFGRLDILVNNAAYEQQQATIEEISAEQLDRTFRTNIYAYFFLAKAALPYLRPGSCIINTGSITGFEGSPHLLDYSATKGAIHAFTKALAKNLVEKGIRVNCVAPGPIWTPLVVSDDKDANEASQFGADNPSKRPGQPQEVAPAFVFFASDADSSYITGEILTPMGGRITAG